MSPSKPKCYSAPVKARNFLTLLHTSTFSMAEEKFTFEYFPPTEAKDNTEDDGKENEGPGTGFTNISIIVLSFFYLFSKSLLNCF
jgi:hypothetical protein